MPKVEIEAPIMHDNLLAATNDLRNAARLRPRSPSRIAPQSPCLMRDTRSALHGVFASLGTYIEQTLQPLAPYIGLDAIQAFILENCHELDDLAACRKAGSYIEDLSVTASGGRSLGFEVEGSLGVAPPRGSTSDVSSQRR